MRRETLQRRLSLPLILAILSAPTLALAQEKQSSSVPEIREETLAEESLIPPEISPVSTTDQSSDLPAQFADAPFERFVDLRLVSEAIASHNAELLTDAALQLAEGERVLLRPHRSGISSGKLLATAGRLAASTQDNATLERLSKAATALNNKALAEKIAVARQLLGAARSVEPSLSVSLETTNLETVSDVKGWIDVVQEATVIGDKMGLQAIREALEDSSTVSAVQKEAIFKQIDEGIASIPEPDAEDPLLLQLASPSRSESDRTAVRERIAAGGWYIVWGKTIAAGEYAACIAAIATGTIGAYFGALLDANIAKMKAQLPGVASSVLLDAVKRAMKGGAIVRVGKLGIKGGLATYRYWHIITVKVPDGTEKYKINGPFGTWTWGYRPKFKTVTKQVPAEPNNHQPYFGFRVF